MVDSAKKRKFHEKTVDAIFAFRPDSAPVFLYEIFRDRQAKPKTAVSAARFI